MQYQAVLIVPEDLEVSAKVTEEIDGETVETDQYVEGNEFVAVLYGYTPEWPGVQPFPSTRIVSGTELVHAIIETDSEDPAVVIRAMLAAYGKDWELVGLSTPDAHLQYDVDDNPILTDVEVPVLDENGEPTFDENGDPITTTEQQHLPLQIVDVALPAATMLEYMQDVIVDDINPENPVFGRPTVASVPHVWDGRLPIAIE